MSPYARRPESDIQPPSQLRVALGELLRLGPIGVLIGLGLTQIPAPVEPARAAPAGTHELRLVVRAGTTTDRKKKAPAYFEVSNDSTRIAEGVFVTCTAWHPLLQHQQVLQIAVGHVGPRQTLVHREEAAGLPEDAQCVAYAKRLG